MHDREQIKRNVIDHLNWDSRVDAGDVKVHVSDKKVELSGTVPSYSALRAAQTDAYTVPGVKEVENNLQLKYPEPLPSDADIELRVRNILMWTPDLDATDIEVNVESGVVTLDGTVDSLWKKHQAAELAMNIGGVLNIVNNLAITPMQSTIDDNIAKRITEALERDSTVDAEQVVVAVETGFVTLSGTVSDWYAKNAVHDAVVHTPGVTGVEDELRIR